MSSSIKLILFKGKTHADGSHPIMLQYTKDGRIKRKVIHKCQEKDWDSKSNRVKSKAPNSAFINNHISEIFAEAEKELFKVKQGQAETISIFQGTTNMTVGDAIELERGRLIKLLKPTPYAQLMAYKEQMGKLAKTSVVHVNLKWFTSLVDLYKDLGNQPATIEKKVKHIRRILAKYSDHELSKEVKNLKITVPKPLKQKLTAEELASVSALELKEGSNLAVARDIFMLQVYLRGVRIGDLLQAYNHQFIDGRFNYTSEKTSKEMGIKLVPQASAIIDKYKGKFERLFPFFQWVYDPKASRFDNERKRLKHKESCTSMVNNNLKRIATRLRITKPLSSHIARHTFARMAIDKINNPMVTMELLGHSSLAIHQAYLNDIRKDDVLDAAADDIFNGGE